MAGLNGAAAQVINGEQSCKVVASLSSPGKVVWNKCVVLNFFCFGYCKVHFAVTLLLLLLVVARGEQQVNAKMQICNQH